MRETEREKVNVANSNNRRKKIENSWNEVDEPRQS